MIICECIDKFRENNNIKGYRIKDQYGNIRDVEPESLKNAISLNEIMVVNLILTSDWRLIDTTNNEKMYSENDIKLMVKKLAIMGTPPYMIKWYKPIAKNGKFLALASQFDETTEGFKRIIYNHPIYERPCYANPYIPQKIICKYNSEIAIQCVSGKAPSYIRVAFSNETGICSKVEGGNIELMTAIWKPNESIELQVHDDSKICNSFAWYLTASRINNTKA